MGQITRTNFGLTKTVTLGDAAIKGLGDTVGPAVLVSGIPGAIIIPVLVILRLLWFGDYSGIDASAILAVDWAGSTSGNILTTLFEAGSSKVSYLLAGGADAFAVVGPNARIDDPMSPVALLSQVVQGANFAVGQDLTFAADNDGNDFTNGDPRNTLTVTVFYNVVPVS